MREAVVAVVTKAQLKARDLDEAPAVCIFSHSPLTAFLLSLSLLFFLLLALLFQQMSVRNKRKRNWERKKRRSVSGKRHGWPTASVSSCNKQIKSAEEVEVDLVAPSLFGGDGSLLSLSSFLCSTRSRMFLVRRTSLPWHRKTT
jgi:hypothetical protein